MEKDTCKGRRQGEEKRIMYESEEAWDRIYDRIGIVLLTLLARAVVVAVAVGRGRLVLVPVKVLP